MTREPSPPQSARRVGNREAAKWDAFTSLLAEYVDLGNFLIDDVLPNCATGAMSGDALRKAMADKSSGVYFGPDKRKAIPSGSVLSRALIIARLHTARRLGEYRKVTDAEGRRNSAKVEDYAQWLRIVETGEVGNRSTVNLAAMTITGTGKTRKVGPLVRGHSTAAVPMPSAVASITDDLLDMSINELRAIAEDQISGADISKVPLARRCAVARQLIASVILAERSERPL